MTDPRDTVEPGAWWKREQMGRPRPATPMSEAQPETVVRLLSAIHQLTPSKTLSEADSLRIVPLLDAALAEARAAGAAESRAALVTVAQWDPWASDWLAKHPLAAPPLRSPERDQAVIEQLDALGIGFDAPEQRDGLDRWVHALHETLPCDDHDEIADGDEPLCEYLAVALRDRITDPTYLAATPSRPAEERK